MANKSTKHFNHQRFTALIQIPLVIWFIISVVRLIGASWTEFTAWAGEPLTALLLVIFILSIFYHMRLGMDEVIEDYIHKPAARSRLLMLNKVFAVILGFTALFSVIVITLNGTH
ncbi:succinate dehydrogenase, hydrophobic membrane anchor protein [Parvularcula marina]|uniref:succinate dehydrogenase, hydrophobic membrane anchor protein n=1 Tax=Parvularcula marina TaxID=2292771 RepID=UPI0035132036